MFNRDVLVTFETNQPIEDNLAFDIADDLGKYAASVSVNPDKLGGSIVMTLYSHKAEATRSGMRIATKALEKHGIKPATISANLLAA